MRLNETIDLRVPVSEVQDITVVAKVEIRTVNRLGQVRGEKEVTFIQLPSPLKITEHYVTTKGIPFIYATRKAFSDFNVLNTYGEGYFLFKDMAHLEVTLKTIEHRYNEILERMHYSLEDMLSNNAKIFSRKEVGVKQ